MSEIKVNKISPRSGTGVTLGDSGDKFTVPSGSNITINSGASIVNDGTATGFDTDTNDKVKVTTNDTTPGFLTTKVLAGANISLTTGTPSGNETLTIANTAPVFNDDAILNDISTLALHQATNNNSSKYNLVNSNVDVYQDSSAVANLVNVVRDTSGEFMSASSGVALPSNSKILVQSEAANGNTTFTDSSGNNLSITNVSNYYTHSTAQAKFGSSSIRVVNNGNLTGSASSVASLFNIGTNNFSIETWVRFDSAALNTNRAIFTKGGYGVVSTDYDGFAWLLQNSNKFMFYANYGGTIVDVKNTAFSWVADTWYHVRVSRYSNNFYMHINGVNSVLTNNGNPSTSINVGSRDWKIGATSDNGGKWNGYMEEVLFTNGTALSTSTASFTPPTEPYGLVVNATGNYQSTAQTANASVNKISGVVTYTNASGTNTLNTDIILQVSADNGSNFTNAPLTAAGTFSTGVLQAVTNDISVTAGTQLKYKIFFANQSAGSKVARINGVSLSY